MLPVYGLYHTSCIDLPGAIALTRGEVPWVSYGVTLVGPWVLVVAGVFYLDTIITCWAIFVTYCALTAHWLGSDGEIAAVILSVAANSLLVSVRFGLACIIMLLYSIHYRLGVIFSRFASSK